MAQHAQSVAALVGHLNILCYWQVRIVCWVVGALQLCSMKAAYTCVSYWHSENSCLLSMRPLPAQAAVVFRAGYSMMRW